MGWAMLVLSVGDKKNSWKLLESTEIASHASEMMSSAGAGDTSLFLYNLSRISRTKGREWVQSVPCDELARMIESMSLRSLVHSLGRIQEFSKGYFQTVASTLRDLGEVLKKLAQEEDMYVFRWSIDRLARMLGERFCVKAYPFSDFLGEWSTRVSLYCETSRAVRFFPGRRLGIPFSNSPLQNKRYWQWLVRNAKGECKIALDDGAYQAVNLRRSLFPVGVTNVHGEFVAGDVICLTSHKKEVFGAGVVNYSSEDLKRIMGKKSEYVSIETGILPNRVMDNDLLVVGRRFRRLREELESAD